ncbi:putative urease accessory protein UreF-like [Madurella mycetomatis]|uniref:Urease accessory protein UreF-like n=1 Tax=Madurella mycetomatis TaxID=100816 RepID=A0A175W5C0_9PEZI|nr:putative urease accessory protein UreF-like [Madurella mycetomatis]
MISWALKRNSDSARDAQTADDTTQIEQPDTPAPVFAVRALKTALFGTPAPRDRRATSKTTSEKTAQQNTNPASQTDKSPAKPPGILLTPGTGTTRRKRVSFGHDVKQGSGGPAGTSTSGLPDDCPGKFPSPWVDRNADAGQPRPKTKLQTVLEESRNSSIHESLKDERDFARPAKEQAEDAWEEVDDESECDADVTTDLNEPHSRSGKYWKSFFETYHTDAKAEMEKLVKYKQLAKSYAKMKDAEALDLNQKLKEEQEKVKAMEEKVAEMSRQASLTTRRKGGECDPRMTEELNKQTALAMEYKKQVEELESLLHEEAGEPRDNGHQPRRVASPRTQRTLMETQRELRRARSQVRELEKLQGERDRLRSDLRFAEQRAAKLAEENRKLSGELSQSASRIQELEKRLEDSKGSYDKLKEDAKARYLEAQQVLQKKNEKISELQEEIVSLKRDRAEPTRQIRSSRAKSFDGKATTFKYSDYTEGLVASREPNRPSSQKGPTAPVSQVGTRHRERRSTESSMRASYDDVAFVPSRTLREKLETEFDTKAQSTSVLSDRGNLQDSRSSASSGRSAHTREEQPRPDRTDRAVRSTWAATSEEITSLNDRLGEAREKRFSKMSSEQLKKPPARPSSRESETPEIDLVQGNFARLGGPDAHSSAVWGAMNTSRTTLPAARRAAAIARLQRKKAEREMQQHGRDKENTKLSFHFLLLLSDSALPLGSFAFSSGLESYLAHQKLIARQPSSFASFLPLSVSSYASTTLPFVLAAHRDPHSLPALDDAQDATIVCTVGRRASVAQGRALLAIWERSFAAAGSGLGVGGGEECVEILRGFSALLKTSSAVNGATTPTTTITTTTTTAATLNSSGASDVDAEPPPAVAHLAPLFGVICRLVGLSLEQTAYVFLLGHVKALVSAAVRAGMFGPYQAQKILAGGVVQGLIAAMVRREWKTGAEEAGQNVPVMDLWAGRHELLYSRIFNS